jgi:hypothetical protein
LASVSLSSVDRSVLSSVAGSVPSWTLANIASSASIVCALVATICGAGTHVPMFVIDVLIAGVIS